MEGIGPIEHLAAATAIAGLRDWLLVADSADLPLLDGSALPWWSILPAVAGEEPRKDEFRPVEVQGSRGRIDAVPSTGFELDVVWTDGPHGPERWRGGRADLPGLLPARTFARADDWWRAREAGLLRGVGPDSGRLFAPREGRLPREAVEVLEREGLAMEGPVWTGGVERVGNECAAHKALDLVGDIAVALGYLPPIRITARDAGHPLHAQLGRALRESIDRARG